MQFEKEQFSPFRVRAGELGTVNGVQTAPRMLSKMKPKEAEQDI
jgi:hypothetical protein